MEESGDCASCGVDDAGDRARSQARSGRLALGFVWLVLRLTARAEEQTDKGQGHAENRGERFGADGDRFY